MSGERRIGGTHPRSTTTCSPDNTTISHPRDNQVPGTYHVPGPCISTPAPLQNAKRSASNGAASPLAAIPGLSLLKALVFAQDAECAAFCLPSVLGEPVPCFEYHSLRPLSNAWRGGWGVRCRTLLRSASTTTVVGVPSAKQHAASSTLGAALQNAMQNRQPPDTTIAFCGSSTLLLTSPPTWPYIMFRRGH